MSATFAKVACGDAAYTCRPWIPPPAFPTEAVPEEYAVLPTMDGSGSCAGPKHEGLPILGGLPGRLRDFLVSYYAQALRCETIAVAGGTMRRHGRQLGNQRDNKTRSMRSERYDRVNRCKACVLKTTGFSAGTTGSRYWLALGGDSHPVAEPRTVNRNDCFLS